MAPEEAMVLTALSIIGGTFLGVPCVLLWLCNRGPDGKG
jgi:hypothetical protein